MTCAVPACEPFPVELVRLLDQTVAGQRAVHGDTEVTPTPDDDDQPAETVG